jgi:peroxiredoxin
MQQTIGQKNFEVARCLSAPLTDRLNKYEQLHREGQLDIALLYDALVERLNTGGAGDAAPSVGDSIEAFLLPDSKGKIVSSSELLNRGPLVVSFNRGSWCPFCRLELLALAEIYPEVKAMGGEVVSILPEKELYTERLKTSYGLPFPVLSDIDNAYALANGLMISIGSKLKQVFLEFGVDLEELHGNEGLLVPITATFVVSQQGVVTQAFVDPDFRLRLSPDQVISALSTLVNGN